MITLYFPIPARSGRVQEHEIIIHMVEGKNTVNSIQLFNSLLRQVVYELPPNIYLLCKPIVDNRPTSHSDPRLKDITDALLNEGVPPGDVAVSKDLIAIFDPNAGSGGYDANIPWDTWDMIYNRITLYQTGSPKDVDSKSRPVVSKENRFPHQCPKCHKPCYIGFMSVEHMSGSCG